LPIKLPSGQIQKVAGSTKLPSQLKKPVVVEDSEDESEFEEEEVVPEGQGLGRRWGRAAVADVVGIKDPAARKRAVKEQIASLGAEIVGGGEIVDNVSSSLHSTARQWRFLLTCSLASSLLSSPLFPVFNLSPFPLSRTPTLKASGSRTQSRSELSPSLPSSPSSKT
jgi:hypothetical protein